MSEIGDITTKDPTGIKIDLIVIIPIQLAQLAENHLVLFKQVTSLSSKYTISSFLDFKNNFIFANKRNNPEVFYVISQDYEGVAYAETFRANLQYILPSQASNTTQNPLTVTQDSIQLQAEFRIFRSIFTLDTLLSSKSLGIVKWRDQSDFVDKTIVKLNQVILDGMQHFDMMEDKNTNPSGVQSNELHYSYHLLQAISRILLFISAYFQYEKKEQSSTQVELKIFTESLIKELPQLYQFLVKAAIHRFLSGYDKSELSEIVRMSTRSTLLQLDKNQQIDLISHAAIWNNNFYLSPLHFYLDISAATNANYIQFKTAINDLKSETLTSLERKCLEDVCTRLEHKVVNVPAGTDNQVVLTFISPPHISKEKWERFKRRLQSQHFQNLLKLYPFKSFEHEILSSLRLDTIDPIYRLLYDNIKVRFDLYPRKKYSDIVNMLEHDLVKLNSIDEVDKLFLNYISQFFIQQAIDLFPDEGSIYHYLATVKGIQQGTKEDFLEIENLYQHAFKSFEHSRQHGFYLTKLEAKTKVNHIFLCARNNDLELAFSSIHETLDYYQNNVSNESFTYAHAFLALLCTYQFYDEAYTIYKWYTTLFNGKWALLSKYFSKFAEILLIRGHNPIHHQTKTREFLEYHFEHYKEIDQGGVSFSAFLTLFSGVIASLTKDTSFLGYIISKLENEPQELHDNKFYAIAKHAIVSLYSYYDKTLSLEDCIIQLSKSLKEREVHPLFKPLLSLMIIILLDHELKPENPVYREEKLKQILKQTFDILKEDTEAYTIILSRIFANQIHRYPESERNPQVNFVKDNWDDYSIPEILEFIYNRLFVEKLVKFEIVKE